MLRAIKYELCPNKSQRILIKKTCGCARLIYNLSLAKKNHEYEANGSSLSEYDLNNELTKLKRKEEYNFLNEVPSQALQQSIHNLSQAFTNFFKNPGHFGFPKFKKKGIKDSFRIPVACEVDYLEWKVKVAKLGWVKFYKGHNKKINGTIICRELLGMQQNKSKKINTTPAARNDEYYKTRPCLRNVIECATIIDNCIIKNSNKINYKVDFLQVANPDHVTKVVDMADIIWRECYKGILSDEQIEYMVDKYQSDNNVIYIDNYKQFGFVPKDYNY